MNIQFDIPNYTGARWSVWFASATGSATAWLIRDLTDLPTMTQAA